MTGSDEIISEALNITEDISLEADWTKIHSVNYRYNFYPQINPDINSDSIRVDDKYTRFLDGQKLILPEEEPTFTNYTFLGWSLDGKTVINFDDFEVTENLEIFAVWQAKQVKVHFNTNGGSVELNGNLFNSSSLPELYVDFDELVSLNKPTCENRELAYYLIAFNENWFSGTTIRGYKLSNTSFNCQTIYSILNQDNTPTVPGGTETTPASEISNVYIYAIWSLPEDKANWTVGDYQNAIGSQLGMFSGSDKFSEAFVGEMEELRFSKNVANCYGISVSDTLSAEEVQAEVLDTLKEFYKISEEQFTELKEQGFYKAMYEIIFNIGEQS